MSGPATVTVALVGMPGGGKSTVGRHLARRLGCGFVDIDHVIERRLGGSIREFFEREGEARFRELESEVLAEELAQNRGVLATGGGAVLAAVNRAALKREGVCIYLHSTPEDLFRRLRRDTRRPLLQVPDPQRKLRELYAVRDPLYREVAGMVIETGRPSVPALVGTIAARLGFGTPAPSTAPAPPAVLDATGSPKLTG